MLRLSKQQREQGESVETPYSNVAEAGIWKRSVASKNFLEIEGIWQRKIEISSSDKIITAGSCFAQHISKALRDHKYNWVNYEAGPAWLMGAQLKELNYGVYSFRTSNIYTVRALRQWIEWAFDNDRDEDALEVWQTAGRFYDPFRPAIEKNGFESREEVSASHQTTLRAIRSAVLDADLFIFTLGLTEAWRNKVTDETYAICPGTIAGEYDPIRHEFVNYDYSSILEDAEWVISFLKQINPKLKILLTVSPVPLVMTASGQHVLTATTYSKSVLRSVAGYLSMKHSHIDYFPSYEIVSSFPFKGAFFEANMREVSASGVAHVMKHFISALKPAPKVQKSRPVEVPKNDLDQQDYVVCEEMALEKYA